MTAPRKMRNPTSGKIHDENEGCSAYNCVPVEPPVAPPEPQPTSKCVCGDPKCTRLHHRIGPISKPSEPQPSRCGKIAASFIPRTGISFACVLDSGHNGECRPGGTCVKHGGYVGEPRRPPKCQKCSEPKQLATYAEPQQQPAGDHKPWQHIYNSPEVIIAADVREQLTEYADPNCRNCDGSGVFYGSIAICPCILNQLSPFKSSEPQPGCEIERNRETCANCGNTLYPGCYSAFCHKDECIGRMITKSELQRVAEEVKRFKTKYNRDIDIADVMDILQTLEK